MKTSKSLFIKLTKPQLIQVRRNFREVLSCAMFKVMGDVSNEIKRIIYDENGNYRDLDGDDKEYVRTLRTLRSKLRNSLYKSIVHCQVCRTIGSNRYYNPIYKEWICPDCLALLRNNYVDLKIKHDEGKHIGDFDLEYLRSYTDL